MAKDKIDWADDDEEIIYVSKSEIKRDAEDLKVLGSNLVALSRAKLDQIELDEVLKDAILVATRIKMEAKRRQLQYIGKLLRNLSEEEVKNIQLQLDRVNQVDPHSTMLLQKAEKCRDLLLEDDKELLASLIEEYPALDVQRLRQMIRGAKKEKSQNKLGKNYKELFQILKEGFFA